MIIKVKYHLDQNCIVYNSFEEIPNYNLVIYLDCGNNQLTSLPELPNSLQVLKYRNNKFIKSDNWKSYMIKYITYSLNQDIGYFIENIINSLSIECNKCNKTFILESIYSFNYEYTIKNSKCLECK